MYNYQLAAGGITICARGIVPLIRTTNTKEVNADFAC